MDSLRCVVEHITFQSAETGYTVIKVRVKGCSDLVAAVGTMPDVHVGSVLQLAGFWKVDGKYGRQFNVQTFEETLPATVYGIEKYLGSGLIKGVGPKFAKMIVEQFGADTLEVIEADPDRLNEIPGIGEKRVSRIKESWKAQKEIKNIMLFLQSHDVSTAHATRIWKAYGNKAIEVVEDNPYRLADDIWGIGFKTADTIAGKLGFDHEKYVRLRGGLLYSLNQLSGEGHCYADREMLVCEGAKLLEVPEEILHMTLDEMIRSGDVIREDEALYLPVFYYAEVGTAKKITGLLRADKEKKIDPDRLLESVEKQFQIHYDKIQLQAIRTAVSSKFMILTGGPGTGKTTATQGIIQAYRMAGCDVVLAAPTGRAAKRMSEATGMEAKTIHRLLEVKPPEGYKRNEDNPLEGDVLILDECSMIDIMLMHALLKAVPPAMTVIMVGDTDQLPSVGAGNVLNDIIRSGAVPVVTLKRIFRQAQGSRIVMNAHRIDEGRFIDISNAPDSDFLFTESTDPEEALQKIVHYAAESMPAYYHADAIRDIQVLTPMQRGIAGAVNLNQVLQEKLNPSRIFLKRGGTEFRDRDKVMQIRNDYDKEVFNGDIGNITHVDTKEQELTVDFEGREVTYDVTELDELVLAYATTIHKAQGSEYPIVVMPFMMTHFVMLQRNLLYTGVTRAKKALLLIGEKKALAYAIRNEKVAKRNTRLAERLQDMMQKTLRQSPGTDLQPEILAAGKKEQAGRIQTYVRKITDQTESVRLEAAPFTNLFDRLSQSAFRSRFHLGKLERSIVNEKGMDTIREHALQIIRNRLAPAEIPNDGKQTPMRKHPVFIAQHATATCCRGCLEKWHHIPKGREMTSEEQSYAADVIMEWIRKDMA